VVVQVAPPSGRKMANGNTLERSKADGKYLNDAPARLTVDRPSGRPEAQDSR